MKDCRNSVLRYWFSRKAGSNHSFLSPPNHRPDNSFASQAENLRLELKNLINKYSFLKDPDLHSSSEQLLPTPNKTDYKRVLPSVPTFRKRSLTENLQHATTKLASKYLQTVKLSDEAQKPLIEVNSKRPSIGSIVFMSTTPSTHFNDCSCEDNVSESTTSTIPCTESLSEAIPKSSGDNRRSSVNDASKSSQVSLPEEVRRSSIKSNREDASSPETKDKNDEEVVPTNMFKRVGKVTFRQDVKMADDDASSCNASDSSGNASVSLPSTEYGGSDRYNHSRYREASTRSAKEHPGQELREPLDHHHHAHYNHREGSVKKGRFTRSLSNTEVPTDERTGRIKTSSRTF